MLAIPPPANGSPADKGSLIHRRPCASSWTGRTTGTRALGAYAERNTPAVMIIKFSFPNEPWCELTRRFGPAARCDARAASPARPRRARAARRRPARTRSRPKWWRPASRPRVTPACLLPAGDLAVAGHLPAAHRRPRGADGDRASRHLPDAVHRRNCRIHGRRNRCIHTVVHRDAAPSGAQGPFRLSLSRPQRNTRASGGLMSSGG